MPRDSPRISRVTDESGFEQRCINPVHINLFPNATIHWIKKALGRIEWDWKDKSDDVKYVPLQSKPGDLAVYLQNSSYEIEFKNEKYVIVPHSAILLLIRDEDLFRR